ncbi:MAG TPA: FliM/FliN family flagellar motor switch protein [Pyrinomonadaceae bacterium]|jgi:type III secretion system YscQ/HrcQ family protein
MAIPNQIGDTDSAIHSSGAPRDPFAVDFFGGSAAAAEEDEELFDEKVVFEKRIQRRAKKSDWSKKLPRISHAEAEFSNLLANLPENFTDRAARVIAETVARYAFQSSENVSFNVAAVSEVNLQQTLSKLNEAPRVYVSVGSRAENAAAWIALDVEFAAALIDSMLGGGTAPGSRRELSPIETTIVEYIAAAVLREINESTDDARLFLNGVSAAPIESFDAFERGASAVIVFQAGNLNGVIDVLAPHRFLKALDSARPSLTVKKNDRKNLRAFEKFAPAVDLSLQIGATLLDADSLLFLEPEDVVLIEQPLFDFQNGDFGGNMQIFAGRSRSFRIRGSAASDAVSGHLNFRIEEIISEEARRRVPPAKFKMDEKEMVAAEESEFENDSPETENTDEEALDEQITSSLENIQVALRVEIAGSKISLRELQALRAGQIIALGVSPTDPVRLVTDNTEEPVATGELVEIEGKLGVRLTKVFI